MLIIKITAERQHISQQETAHSKDYLKIHSAEDEGTVKGTSRASEVSQFSKWGSLLSSKD